MWEDAPNTTKDSVEKRRLKSVENAKESGIMEQTRFLTLDNLTRDVLKTKPPNARIPKEWIKAGGSIGIDGRKFS